MTLTIAADKTTVDIGESVTFTVSSSVPNDDVWMVYINDSLVAYPSSNTFSRTFTADGSFTVQCMNDDNYEWSNTIEITVTNPNTLCGALHRLGESLASTLNNMGVTTATSSDGLTTLSNQIGDGLTLTITHYDSTTETINVIGLLKSGVLGNASRIIVSNKLVESIETNDGSLVYQRQMNTQLSIDVPLVLVYSDAFNISGVLSDSYNAGIVGATVYLKVGNTVVDSTTTTTGGGYSFTRTPVAVGNHSFQVVYNGDNLHNSSESSTVSRVVNKETTVLNVNSPNNQSTVLVGETISIAGTLQEDDGVPMVGKTVNVNMEE